MKIGILTQYYPPETGAPQARLSGLARRFVERGHEVHVLTAMPNYPKGKLEEGYSGLYRRESLEGALLLRTFIYPTNSPKMIPRLTNYFSFVLSSVAIGGALLPRLDYLMTESPPLFLGISGYILSRAKRARWIFNVSDLWPESAVRLGVIQDGAALRISEALERFCYREAHVITGQSSEIVQNIRARFPAANTFHLSNGVDVDTFTPERRSGSMRSRLAGSASVVAVYAGLHGIAQGLEQLLMAAAFVRDVQGLKFVFVGDGPARRELIALAQGMNLTNVEFMDAVPRSEVPAILASSDIALIPLKSHLPGAVPSKIYEAMASGLPIVLAAAGEACGIVEQSNSGIAVKPGHPEGIAGAVRRLCFDPGLRRELSLCGRRAALHKYDRAGITGRFIDFLEDNLEQKLPSQLQRPSAQTVRR